MLLFALLVLACGVRPSFDMTHPLRVLPNAHPSNPLLYEHSLNVHLPSDDENAVHNAVLDYKVEMHPDHINVDQEASILDLAEHEGGIIVHLKSLDFEKWRVGAILSGSGAWGLNGGKHFIFRVVAVEQIAADKLHLKTDEGKVTDVFARSEVAMEVHTRVPSARTPQDIVTSHDRVVDRGHLRTRERDDRITAVEQPDLNKYYSLGEKIKIQWTHTVDLTEYSEVELEIKLKEATPGIHDVRFQLKLKEARALSVLEWEWTLDDVLSAYSGGRVYAEIQYVSKGTFVDTTIAEYDFNRFYYQPLSFVFTPWMNAFGLASIPVAVAPQTTMDVSSVVVELHRWQQPLGISASGTLLHTYDAQDLSAPTSVSFDLSVVDLTPSVLPYYFLFDVDGFSYPSPFFVVLSNETSGDWNYNETSEEAEEVIDIYEATCGSVVTPPFVDVCGDLPDIEVSSKCTNCWFKFDYSFMRFVFSTSGSSLDSFELTSAGCNQVNIDTLTTVFYADVLETVVPLLTATIWGLDVSLGDSSFQAGIFLNLGLALKLDFSGEGTIAAGFDAELTWDVTTTYNGTDPVISNNVEFSLNHHPLEIELDADVLVEVGFQAEVQAGLIAPRMFDVTAAITPTLVLDTRGSTRGFPGGVPGIPDAPLLYGSCNRNHLVKYDAVGVVRTGAAAFLDIYVPGYSALPHYTRTVDWEGPEFGPFPVASGCLFDAPTTFSQAGGERFNGTACLNMTALEILLKRTELAALLNTSLARILAPTYSFDDDDNNTCTFTFIIAEPRDYDDDQRDITRILVDYEAVSNETIAVTTVIGLPPYTPPAGPPPSGDPLTASSPCLSPALIIVTLCMLLGVGV